MTDNRVRNISVIAHVDHGKTTLTDTLVQASGISKKTFFMDSARVDSAERGITIKSTGISMELGGLLVNLIDSPGHVDFSSEVSAALRVTDGALVVVDAIGGPAVQTATVLRQAAKEGVHPVLVLNKLDMAFLGKKLASEDIYLMLRKVVENMNALAQGHEFAPARGNVAFGSAKQGWLLSLPRVAQLYAAKSGASVEQLLKLLWGDRFSDAEGKRWSKQQQPGGVRGFCRMVLEPLQGIFAATMGDTLDWPRLVEACAQWGMEAPGAAKSLAPRAAQELVLKTLFPAEEELIRLMRDHLPSPQQAQQRRMPILYTGDHTDAVAQGIAACDAHAPLCVFVSKLVPAPGGKGLNALARIFSGTLAVGSRVHVVDADYVPGESPAPRSARVTKLQRPRGPAPAIALDIAVAGDIVLIGGVDAGILKSATLLGEPNFAPIRQMKLSVTPVVHRAVSVPPGGLGPFQKALVLLSQTDPLAQVRRDEESGEVIVGASGELHLEVLLGDLQQLVGERFPVTSTEPLVSYRETVAGASQEPALAKSTNKHNRVWSSATVYEDGLSVSKKVWAVDQEERNALQDGTSSVPYLAETKSSLLDAFREVTLNGPLANEPIRDVCITITDAKFHADSVHRNASQVGPAAKRSFRGAILLADPAMLEPIFELTVEAPSKTVAQTVYSILGSRRGAVVSDSVTADGSVLLVCNLPVSESFGFDAEVRARTSGSAFCSMRFSHYDRLPGDPLVSTSLAGRVVADIRKRKGLNPEIELSRYVDRL